MESGKQRTLMLLEMHLLCLFSLSVRGHSALNQENGEFTEVSSGHCYISILYYILCGDCGLYNVKVYLRIKLNLFSAKHSYRCQKAELIFQNSVI